MKKEYKIPMAEKLEFNYTDTVTASSGNAMRWWTDGYDKCHETESDPAIWIYGNSDLSCEIKGIKE